MPSVPLAVWVVLSGAVAVAGVGANEGLEDAFSVTARVEARQPDGSWTTVASPVPFGQGGPIESADHGQRIVVHNRGLTGHEATVEISYYNDGTVLVRRDVWSLGPRERQELVFTIPDAAYQTPPDATGPVREGVLVYVTVDDLRMSLNVMRGSGR